MNAPTPALPHQRTDLTNEKRNSYISTNDAEQSRRSEINSDIYETGFNDHGESFRKSERYSSLDESELNDRQEYFTLSLPKEESHGQGKDNDVFRDDQENVTCDGFYDEVGAVSPDNGLYDTPEQ